MKLSFLLQFISRGKMTSRDLVHAVRQSNIDIRQ